MIPIVKIWLFETDLLDPYFIGEKDGITVTLENDDNIDFLNIKTVTYFMNSIVKGAFSEDFKYGGEDGGIAESTGKNEKAYELQFNMPIENRDNLNRFAGSQYSLLAQRVDGSRFVVFGQFEADDLTVDNRIQNRMTLKTDDTSARLFEVNSFNIENIEYIIDDVVTPTPPPIPDTPTGFSFVAIGEDEIDVNWNAQSDVDNFIIEWDEDGFSFNNSASVDGDQTNYIIEGLTPGVVHYGRMKAVNISGESGYTTILNTTTESDFTDPDGIQAIINSGVTNPFAQQEIYNLVIRAKAAGTNNWDEYDYFNGLNLGSGNVTDWKLGLTAIINGGVSFDEFGPIGDGVSGYIDPNTDLANPLFSSSVDNQAMGVFLNEANTGRTIFGINDGSSRTVLEETIAQGFAWSVNTLNREPNTAIFNSNTLEVISRDSSNSSSRYIDGVVSSTSSEVSVSIPSGNPFILARNSSGSPDNYTNHRVSVSFIRSANNFDYAAENEYITLYVASIASGTSFTDYATAKAWLDAN